VEGFKYKVVDIQNSLGSDIQMVLDNFSPYPSTEEQDLKAFDITNLWAKRAREHFLKSDSKNFQFAIIQGGLDETLRDRSLAELSNIGFDGYAVGGLSVGEPVSEFERIVIKNVKHKFDKGPLDERCDCYTCRNFSKSYLRHLYLSKEISSSILNSIHNIYFYLDFMAKIRYAIQINRFNIFKKEFLSEYIQ